ncbi:uncharacterized protein LOC106163657 [Lingula anatina]|uniref:DNA-directed DNA polymerase n=1 Tax=Lingula anatina TaxID=7574 RepID=A0A1S3IET0_LINAN|nr:uncharacterized protein LOC106163657 [Lingula anatina]|eukprot:XP_013396770.1 uncharacterized protein LOC106163657 [Lingula anatina]
MGDTTSEGSVSNLWEDMSNEDDLLNAEHESGDELWDDSNVTDDQLVNHVDQFEGELGMGVDYRRFYNLRRVNERRMKKFSTVNTDYQLTFSHLENRSLNSMIPFLRELFQNIFDDLVQNMLPHDLVRIVLQSDTLEYPISIAFTRVSEFTVDLFLDELIRVLQSHEELRLDASIILTVCHVSMPRPGGARLKRGSMGMQSFLHAKRSVIQIHNGAGDQLCLARALVVAMAKADNDPEYATIVNKRCREQLERAQDLHTRAGVPLGPCGVPEIKQFQSYLSNYQISVFSGDHFMSLIHKGPSALKELFLFYHKGHYDVITSITGFMGRAYYCTECNIGFDHMGDHSCEKYCERCKRDSSCKFETWRHCDQCSRNFLSDSCFRNHTLVPEQGRWSTCRRFTLCKKCTKFVDHKRENKHVCYTYKCKSCNKYVKDGHLCYMQIDRDDRDVDDDDLLMYIDENPAANFIGKFKPGSKRPFIFFDFEAQPSHVHTPNLVVAHRVCHHCLNLDVTPTSTCELCGKNEHVFKGPSCVDEFCKWVFEDQSFERAQGKRKRKGKNKGGRSKRMNPGTSSCFDGDEYECENNEEDMIIHNGAILLAHNMSGYDGFFLLKWLKDQCIVPDVILRGAKVLSIKVGDITVLDSYSFLPMALNKLPAAFGLDESLSKGYFPHFFNTPENQDYRGKMPATNFYGSDSMSTGARERYRAERDNVFIQHAHNQGEKKIGKFVVDGWASTTNTVYEYQGRFWHGCPKCYNSYNINNVSLITMGELLERTVDKKQCSYLRRPNM